MNNPNIKAELILASLNSLTGDILYTFKLTYPRFLLSEVNTHKIASKNTSSSRAIPTKKLLSKILKNPFIPSSVGEYQKGMQAGKEITGIKRVIIDKLWAWGRYPAVATSYLAWKFGAPKQFSNRLVEPWMVVEQIWTSTDVFNEITLRNHPDAEPHYNELARQKSEIVTHVLNHFNLYGDFDSPPVPEEISSKCQRLKLGDWHLPFSTPTDLLLMTETYNSECLGYEFNLKRAVLNHKGKKYYFPFINDDFYTAVKKAISCARCAWVSYEMPSEDKMNNLVAALLTYHKLILSNPKHLSPTEHIATPLPISVRVGNFCGWLQHRKEIANEASGDKLVASITIDMAQQLLKHPDEPFTIQLQ